MKKIPECWEDCKTKEQKQAFMDELERLDKTEETISFDEFEKELDSSLEKKEKI